jgi:hypothetical protein
MTRGKLEKYFNDPDIVNEPPPLREIHAIRLMIYDEIKGMTLDERRAYYTNGLDDICRQFNIKIVPSMR